VEVIGCHCFKTNEILSSCRDRLHIVIVGSMQQTFLAFAGNVQSNVYSPCRNDTIIFFNGKKSLKILVKDSLDVPHGFLVKLPVLVNICKIFGII
jgi:hypothetical protein